MLNDILITIAAVCGAATFTATIWIAFALADLRRRMDREADTTNQGQQP